MITDRMIAHPLSYGDLGELCDFHRDPTVMKFLGGPRTTEESQRWLDENLAHWKVHGFGIWIFHSKKDKTFVGRCGLRYVQVEDKIEVELAYSIAPQFWGKGMATEMACASLATGFESLALESVIVLVDANNTRSRNVAKRLGFHFGRNAIWKSSPTMIHRLDRYEWIPARQSNPDPRSQG